MVSAICNIYINSQEKFELFKETFPLVYSISDNWLVYIRGKFRKNVIAFIKSQKNAKQNCVFFNNLFKDDWAKSTRQMLEKSRYDTIYVFLEDHFLLKPISHFKSVIYDMVRSEIEFFPYSFFNIGISTNSSEGLNPDYSKHFYSFSFGWPNIARLKKTNKDFYPFSLASVCTKNYFKRLLDIEDKILIKVPFLLQVVMENILFMYPRNRQFWADINRVFSPLKLRFVLYTPASPFNLERSLFDIEKDLLPIKVGGLKEELFANWDDDNKLSNSSLVKRGLYPKSLVAHNVKFKPTSTKSITLQKGKSTFHQYCPIVQRTLKIPLKYIHISDGILEISTKNERYVLRKGKYIWVHANIPHNLTAIKSCTYDQHIADGI
ncbi:MAG: hypothetical protein C0412_02915 [Flavobacterium sp.]|nr:hypothetical protein [Flavobacterium sp.]